MGLERALRREDVAPSVYGRERFPARGHGGRTRERARAARRRDRSVGGASLLVGVGRARSLATSSLDGRRATHLSTISKRRGWIWRASSPSLASRTSRRVMFSISIASPARDVGRDATAVSHSAPTEGMERWTSRRFVPPPAWECASVPARSAARSLVADRSGAPMHCLPPLTQRYAVRDGGNARGCLPTADVQTAGGKNPQRSPPSSHEKIFPNFTENQSENFAGKTGIDRHSP